MSHSIMNRFPHFVCTVVLSLLTAMTTLGCATPVGYTDKPMQSYDKDTTYRVDDTPSGFVVTVYYSRYQFIPESDVVAAAGKAVFLNIAKDTAKTHGKQLKPLDESRLRWSMGRNGLSGITSWSGNAEFEFAEASQADPKS